VAFGPEVTAFGLDAAAPAEWIAAAELRTAALGKRDDASQLASAAPEELAAAPEAVTAALEVAAEAPGTPADAPEMVITAAVNQSKTAAAPKSDQISPPR
jgi:hypothetical protein